MGTFEGDGNVVKSDMATVAQLNSLIISNAENQVYAHDHTFKFKRRMPDELESGATRLQDKDFILLGRGSDGHSEAGIPGASQQVGDRRKGTHKGQIRGLEAIAAPLCK
jgi:hypothetical protein